MLRIGLGVLFALCFTSKQSFGQVTKYAPQVVNGSWADNFWATEFHIVNTSTTDTVNVTIRLKTNEGRAWNGFLTPRTLLPTSTTTLVLRPLTHAFASTTPTGDFTVGWAEIESSKEVPATALLQHRRRTLGRLEVIATASLKVERAGRDYLSPAYLNLNGRQDPPINTGIALLNPSAAETASVNIQLLQDGNVIVERTITVPPQTKISQFLSELGVLQASVPFVGAVRFTSTQPFGIAVVQVQDLSWIAMDLTPIGSVQSGGTSD